MVATRSRKTHRRRSIRRASKVRITELPTNLEEARDMLRRYKNREGFLEEALKQVDSIPHTIRHGRDAKELLTEAARQIEEGTEVSSTMRW